MNAAVILTLFRALMAPVVVIMILRSQDLMVLALLCLAALTDMADGWLARRLSQVTRLGTILDPIADKLVILGTMIGGALTERLPIWLAWGYALKELLQLAVGGILLARRGGAPIKANRFGKSATTVTFVGFFCLWLGAAFGWWLVLAGLLIGLLAALTYLRQGLAGSIPPNQEDRWKD